MDLPPLDCHAHVAVTVTDRQLARLEPAFVFSMTREPAEAREAPVHRGTRILWGCGAHPGYVGGGGEVDIDEFKRMAGRFAVVGEIGLDRRSGNLHRQIEVFESILSSIRDEPVLVSVHSAGCSAQVVQSIERNPPPGMILHWFTGTPSEVQELLSLGSYFSVNSAMRRDLLKMLPIDRVLPETDYPAARNRTGRRPGDTGGVESLLSEIYGMDATDIRRHFYRNLRRIAKVSGALDRFPRLLAETVLLA